jgi:tumor protein p53-inducible protein 3
MMLAVMCHGAGGPEVLAVEEVPRPEPGPGEVLLKVTHSAINRADTLQRRGAYALPPGAPAGLGLEAAGEVAGLGPGVQGWAVGQRTMALLDGGGNAEYVAVAASLLSPVPAGLSLEQAAAVPEVWLTAYQLLHLVGEVQPGDLVLIHAAGSGVGTAATQLVRRAGGRVVATAGSRDKLDLAATLGAELGVLRGEDWPAAVAKWTGGRGVDIVLDCVGGSYSEGNLASLAPDGRWVLYGLLGGTEVPGTLLPGLLRKRASLRATTLRSRDAAYKARLVAAFTRDCLPGLADGSLRTVVDSVFPLKEIAEAHRKMETNKNIGKIVLKM